MLINLSSLFPEKKPIILRSIGYSNDLTPEMMNKAAFAINVARTIPKGIT